MASATDKSEGFDVIDSFRILSDRVAQLLSACGTPVRAYLDSGLPLYRALPEKKQKAALDQLRVFLQSIEMAAKDGKGFDDPRSLWYALSALKLVPPSDLFDRIPSGSAIEIYDGENIQIWRNWEVMRVCSYTIEEIHCLEWHVRYDRQDVVTAQCFDLVNTLFNGESDIVIPSVPEHEITESRSQERFYLKVDFKIASKLRDRDGQPIAFLLASAVNAAYKTRRRDEPPPDLSLA